MVLEVFSRHGCYRLYTHLFWSAPLSSRSFMHCRLLTPFFVDMEKCRAVWPEEGTASSTLMLQLLRRCLRHSKWPFLAARCKEFSPCVRTIGCTALLGCLPLLINLQRFTSLFLEAAGSASVDRHRFSQAISPTVQASRMLSMAAVRGRGCSSDY